MSLCIMECERRDQGRLNRRYKDPPSLSKTIVVPILDSIIDRDNNSLKYIQFPNNWRDPIDGLLDPFQQSDSQVRCSTCAHLCRETLSVNPGSRMENTHAAQDFTCYVCLNNFCYNCEEEEVEVPVLAACRGCEKEFCSSCVSMIPCGTCQENNYFGCFQSSYYCSSDCAKWFTCCECKRINCGNYAGCFRVKTCKCCNRTACTSCMNFVACGSCNEEHCAIALVKMIAMYLGALSVIPYIAFITG